jgi:hypothetical protein
MYYNTATDVVATKKCPRCEKQLALFKFAKNRCAKDGLQVYCRTCLANIRKKGKLRKPPATKQCAKCKEVFPSSNFWKNKSQKDGLQSYCKVCNRQLNEAYRNNPEKKDRVSLTTWLWRQDNRERYLEAARIRWARYRERHREKLNERTRERRKRERYMMFRELLLKKKPTMA